MLELFYHLLRRHGAITLVQPRFEQRDRGLLPPAEVGRDPAVLAEAVVCRLGEGKVVRHVARMRKLERRAVIANKNEHLPIDLNRDLTPRVIFGRARILQGALSNAFSDLVHVSSANPIILYSKRAPTLASHSVSPGATSQRSRPTIRLPARRTARSRPIASFHDKPPGTGVPVPGQSVGSRPSMSHDR